MARLLSALGGLLLATLPLWAAAMGPNAPFTAPAPRSSTSAAERDAPAPGLRGVRLGKNPAALIDGNWVTPGQAVRGAWLASVRIDGALLRHPGGRTERLALFPTTAADPAAHDRNASPPTDSVQGQP